jgi:hypothetical protein
MGCISDLDDCHDANQQRYVCNVADTARVLNGRQYETQIWNDAMNSPRSDWSTPGMGVVKEPLHNGPASLRFTTGFNRIPRRESCRADWKGLESSL